MSPKADHGQGQWAAGHFEPLNAAERIKKDDPGLNVPIEHSGERQAPFFCPYCGEESLVPSGPDAGAWECVSCARTFRLNFQGLRRPQARPDRAQAETSETGSVALVGGGPGDPGLITVAGQRLLAEADVVVADRLGPRDLLAGLRPGVEVIEAGKAPGAHQLTQSQINELIVARAQAGKRVVRLKGGDPFVFGRGGEEALACAAAGVPVTVVPGVTSAIAVPASAGIPVTHRGVTQDFAVVSAHLDPSQPGATVDWDALANGPGTLVLLMAIAHLDRISAELIKRGRDAATPVAVIRDGTLPSQQVLISTLGEVAADVTAASIRPPAVVVIGEVVRLRDQLAATAGHRLTQRPPSQSPAA